QGLKGRCRVAALVRCDNGSPAARLTGEVWKSRRVPETLVIVDPKGVICGIAQASTIYSENRFLNRVFYLSKVTRTGFVGYIRDYDPQLQYAVRSADHGTLSEETIPVQSPATELATP